MNYKLNLTKQIVRRTAGRQAVVGEVGVGPVRQQGSGREDAVDGEEGRRRAGQHAVVARLEVLQLRRAVVVREVRHHRRRHCGWNEVRQTPRQLQSGVYRHADVVNVMSSENKRNYGMI